MIVKVGTFFLNKPIKKNVFEKKTKKKKKSNKFFFFFF